MTTQPVADATPRGWIRRDELTHGHALLTYPDGAVRFAHTCDRGPRGIIRCAPALRLGEGHTLTRTSDGRPTVAPSVLCDDCGTHGWINAGAWRDA